MTYGATREELITEIDELIAERQVMRDRILMLEAEAAMWRDRAAQAEASVRAVAHVYAAIRNIDVARFVEDQP